MRRFAHARLRLAVKRMAEWLSLNTRSIGRGVVRLPPQPPLPSLMRRISISKGLIGKLPRDAVFILLATAPSRNFRRRGVALSRFDACCGWWID